ncbi:uncharacterized protein LOC6558108 [Drosophila grimshawi]|uniref:GH17162 n=1 Tax=Drosophila grimshawi TaxID=7222 RepID=B4J176_DROGR|nr:uncharacterized protein LOC6558108 [Drosophila grimshawi]EDV97945.1 GH17162 [Drosophila grimshawi]
MGDRTGGAGAWSSRLLLLLLLGALSNIDASPTDLTTDATTELPLAETRAQTEDQDQDGDVLDVDEDLDARSAYINNQFVPSEPIDLTDDEQSAPLYEILQKQMEQVLAGTGSDVPIYEEDKTKQKRVQQVPKKPLFTISNEADADDDYVDETMTDAGQTYVDAEKPDAAAGEILPDAGYQTPPQLSPSTSTMPPSSHSTTVRHRPQRRRTTTALPRTTRVKIGSHSKPTQAAANHTDLLSTTIAPPTSHLSHKPVHHTKRPAPSNSLPPDQQIYQHKRRIVFKTISTGSQFVNSPIGDLMIKFSIGFAKPAPSGAMPSNEALRLLSQNWLRNIELQKFKRVNKVQRD